MTKKTFGKTSNLAFWAESINSLTKTFELPVITAILVLSLVNLILAILVISQLVLTTNTSNLVGKVQSANLKAVKILEPSQNDKVSGEFPIILQSQDNSAKLSSVLVLVDGVLEKEVDVSKSSQPNFTINAGKYLKGPHKLVFKVTDTKGTTQTLQLDVDFVRQ